MQAPHKRHNDGRKTIASRHVRCELPNRARDLKRTPYKQHLPGMREAEPLNEAMACGRPVIATNKTGGAIDLVENGVNGLILDLKNNASLEELIQSSLNNKQLLVEMGRQSQLIIQSFTFNHIATAVEDCMLHKIQKLV